MANKTEKHETKHEAKHGAQPKAQPREVTVDDNALREIFKRLGVEKKDFDLMTTEIFVVIPPDYKPGEELHFSVAPIRLRFHPLE